MDVSELVGGTLLMGEGKNSLKAGHPKGSFKKFSIIIKNQYRSAPPGTK